MRFLSSGSRASEKKKKDKQNQSERKRKSKRSRGFLEGLLSGKNLQGRKPLGNLWRPPELSYPTNSEFKEEKNSFRRKPFGKIAAISKQNYSLSFSLYEYRITNDYRPLSLFFCNASLLGYSLFILFKLLQNFLLLSWPLFFQPTPTLIFKSLLNRSSKLRGTEPWSTSILNFNLDFGAKLNSSHYIKYFMYSQTCQWGYVEDLNVDFGAKLNSAYIICIARPADVDA